MFTKQNTDPGNILITPDEYKQFLNGNPDVFLDEWKELYKEYKSKSNK